MVWDGAMSTRVLPPMRGAARIAPGGAETRLRQRIDPAHFRLRRLVRQRQDDADRSARAAADFARV